MRMYAAGGILSRVMDAIRSISQSVRVIAARESLGTPVTVSLTPDQSYTVPAGHALVGVMSGVGIALDGSSSPSNIDVLINGTRIWRIPIHNSEITKQSPIFINISAKAGDIISVIAENQHNPNMNPVFGLNKSYVAINGRLT